MSATRDFAGKRIFVTGGTSGIGRELAGALARAGADVVVSGTSEASVARLKAAHPNLDGMVLDLADDAGRSRPLDHGFHQRCAEPESPVPLQHADT